MIFEELGEDLKPNYGTPREKILFASAFPNTASPVNLKQTKRRVNPFQTSTLEA